MKDFVRRQMPGCTSRLAVVVMIASGICSGARAQQPSIVGTWEWTRASNGCSEQFVFRNDGTLSIRRGQELTENTYQLSWAPEPGGRYRLMVATVADNGGRDCEGSAEDGTGRQSTTYVLFGQSRETMIQCGSPAGTDCTGLMKRIDR